MLMIAAGNVFHLKLGTFPYGRSKRWPADGSTTGHRGRPVACVDWQTPTPWDNV